MSRDPTRNINVLSGWTLTVPLLESTCYISRHLIWVSGVLVNASAGVLFLQPGRSRFSVFCVNSRMNRIHVQNVQGPYQEKDHKGHLGCNLLHWNQLNYALGTTTRDTRQVWISQQQGTSTIDVILCTCYICVT